MKVRLKDWGGLTLDYEFLAMALEEVEEVAVVGRGGASLMNLDDAAMDCFTVVCPVEAS